MRDLSEVDRIAKELGRIVGDAVEAISKVILGGIARPSDQDRRSPPDAIVPLLNAEDVAKLLNQSSSSIYALARAGVLPCVRLGRKVLFQAEAITEFLAAGGKPLPGGWKREPR